MKLKVHNDMIQIKLEGARKLLMDFRQEHYDRYFKMSQIRNIGKVVTVGQDQSGDLVKIHQMIMGAGKDGEEVDLFCLSGEGGLLPFQSDSVHQSY